MTTDQQPEAERSDKDMSLIEHLTELRQRVVKSIIAVVVGAIVVWVFYDEVWSTLLSPYCDALANLDQESPLGEGECSLVLNQPLEGLSLFFTVVGYGGFIVAIPVVLWQAWQFVVPGLYAHEKQYGIRFVISGATLFFFGAGLAFWSAPRALEFLLDVGGQQFVPLLSPAPYISFLVKMLVAFGLGFQFPIILILAQQLGLVYSDQLKAGRRYAVVGIVVLVAILTPSGDPITLGVLSVPMYLFYEASIIFGWLKKRKAKKQAAKV